MEVRIEMIATTTMSSTIVKPALCCLPRRHAEWVLNGARFKGAGPWGREVGSR